MLERDQNLELVAVVVTAPGEKQGLKMKMYIVSWDLMAPGQNYSRLISAMKLMTARPMLKSMWIVTSNKSSVQLRDELMTLIDRNDKIFVAEMSTTNWAANNIDRTATDWLKQVA